MQWKDVDGYEGYYKVSDTGLVCSVDRIISDKNGKQRKLSGKMMRLTMGKGRNNNGYFVVNLHKCGVSRVIPVHVLVATAFIPNDNKHPTVNHKDGNKANNVVSNLEWASYRDNNVHALQQGLRKARGNAVVQKGMSGNVINVYKSACEASRKTGIGRGSISHCLNNRMSSAGGFIWEKVSEGVTTIP